MADGISYRVQISASHKQVNANTHFNSAYKFSEEKVYVENHEGWIKYVVGSHDIYKSARDRRNQLTANYTFPGPFVTAYNEGERVTVQEALMISNQKWLK